MAAKNRPYEQFGSFILFKKLEADALGDLWRAGRIDGSQLGEVVALRRITGGSREAFVSSTAVARQVVPQLTGTSFAKHQEIDVVSGAPYIAHEYGGGRSLRHVIDRARGGNGVPPNPLPIDQAIVIAEKVALSLSTIADLKMADRKLAHGALVPQFVWINDDGEIRVAGQQLGGGFFASLRDAAFASHFGRYFSPEFRTNGEPSKGSEVFALGAIFYLLITGSEPPDAMTASAFMLAIRGAKTMAGQPIPDDIRVILDKSLNLDVNARYASVGDMKQALSSLAHGGKYSATTFNLAFYLNNLLKKEMEGEALEREKEGKVNVSAYLEPVAAAPAPAAPREDVPPPPMFGGITDEPKKGKAPLVIAAVVVLAILGVVGWLVMKPSGKPAATTTVAATKPQAPPQKAQVIPTAVVATTTAPATATVDPAAQQKAFEAAVQQKLQAEMMKLQADYTKNLQKTQSKNAPVQIASTAPVSTVAATAPEEHAPPSAAALDEKRLSANRQETPAAPAPAPAQTQATAPVTAPATQPAAPATAPTPQVREGDVIDYNELDSPVNPLSTIRPTYPPMAMRSKTESTVIVTTLIDESGNVVDVKVLRGDDRFGFNDAAIRAMRATRFSQPTKNGHRVKTWRPQTISFLLAKG